MNMEITIKKSQDTTFITVSGHFDTNSYTYAMDTLQPVLKDASGRIIIDVKELMYVSSSALRVFLTLRKNSRSAGGTVVIRGMTEPVKQVFAMSGFLPLFIIE